MYMFVYMHGGLAQVDDTRTTLQYVADELQTMGPASVSWLTVFNKLKLKRGVQPPTLKNYWFAHTTADIWIRFPWYVGAGKALSRSITIVVDSPRMCASVAVSCFHAPGEDRRDAIDVEEHERLASRQAPFPFVEQ